MCEFIVQPASSPELLELLTGSESERVNGAGSVFCPSSRPDTVPGVAEAKNIIKPSMTVSAIRLRDGQLECVKARWGWSPVWTMGTMPPRTHLPLHLVMRSRVFDRIRREGRVLVAVDGWYDIPAATPSNQNPSLSYTTSRQSSPMFLAALAQISEKPCGCDGLVLMTCGDPASAQQRLLAFNAENALGWLEPDLQWEQAMQMTAHMAVDEPQLEHVLTSPRVLQGATWRRVDAARRR
ncbi:SOS response-associated peptidase family protein [Pseudomonas sp. SWRI18]|uniref:SOS response-associated peptidase family protein n=1 Tax=Pseudomonas sp. SWRI18 TaxID=2753888 RepID=UPI00164753B1|nr:SOS response-associated peptidase family protein [Pseudomonas sp. SWRI18]MBC3301567.1 SOS response-associated peptidase family protein [Pseudomonas sp. SWRI18]